MTKLSDRIAKLEAATAALAPSRKVVRHVIADETEAERQAAMAGILAGSNGNVLHVFRVIVGQGEAATMLQ